MSNSRLTNSPVPPERYHPVWSNFEAIFLNNFKLIPFFLPSIVSFGLFLGYGGLLFFAGALVLLIPAGPAVCAMYDVSYQFARELPGYERRGFFKSYRMNFRQGAATMAVMTPVIALLLMLLLTEAEKPLWVTLCLILGGLMLMAFGILAFSQVALVALPVGQIWKNALLLIPLTHWRCLVPAAMHLVFLAVLYQWMAVAFLLYLFLGPAMLIAFSAHLLWPRLEQVLLDGEA